MKQLKSALAALVIVILVAMGCKPVQVVAPVTPPKTQVIKNGTETFFLSTMIQLANAGYGSEDSLKKIKFWPKYPIKLTGKKAVRIENGEVVWSAVDLIKTSDFGYINSISTSNGITSFSIEFTIKEAKYLVWFSTANSPLNSEEISFILDEQFPTTVNYKEKSTTVKATSEYPNELQYKVREDKS